MKKSYGKGLAIHIDPESCGAAREDGVEALTGESTGRVCKLVRRNLLSVSKDNITSTPCYTVERPWRDRARFVPARRH